MPRRPGAAGAGWSMTFPPLPGVVGYVICDERRAIRGRRERGTPHLTVTVDIVATEDAAWDFRTEPHNLGTAPASMRAVLIRNYKGAYGRWWSLQSIPLAPGTHTLRIPFAGAQWSSVYGEKGNGSRAARRSFAECLEVPVQLGITFGGGSYYGHGVRMATGEASFRLRRFAV